LAIYCADVGSIQAGNFAWARGERRARVKITHKGEHIAALAERIAFDFNAGRPVALGFECPLFLPVRDDPDMVTCQRDGEAGYAWSAGPGAQSLVLGLAETIWILRTIRRSGIRPFLVWEAFNTAGRGLFLWEAFVTSRAAGRLQTNGRSHIKDAEIAVRLFARRVPRMTAASDIREEVVYSLLGAALLRTGWSKDLKLLETPCVVIKA